MKFSKKVVSIFVLITVCVIAVSVIGFADSDKVINSKRPTMPIHQRTDVKINTVPTKSKFRSKSTNLPSRYNTMEEDWYKGKIKMKNQGATGLCWAFSTTTAAEISYLKETGTVAQTAPAHLGYFLYNRQLDPLALTEGDKNTAIGDTWFDIGGNMQYTSQAMANWTGLALEGKNRFEVFRKGYPAINAYDNYIVQQDTEFINTNNQEAVKKAIYENGAVVVPYFAGYEAQQYDEETGITTYNMYNRNTSWSNHEVAVVGWDDNYSKYNFSKSESSAWFDPMEYINDAEALSIDQEKPVEISVDNPVAAFKFIPEESEVYTFRSLGDEDTIAFLCEYNNTISFNDDGDEDLNFAICRELEKGKTYYLVTSGLYEIDEDNLSYKILVEKGGEPETDRIPKNNGAWIIQNSWGDNFKNYYISYEDSSFGSVGEDESGNTVYYVRSLDMQSADTYAYNYQYDGTSGSEVKKMSAGDMYANVYPVGDSDISLDAVGLTTWTDGTVNFDVKVYSDLDNNQNPESGVQQFVGSYTTNHPGSYTFELSEEQRIILISGTLYSIVITAKTDDTLLGVEKDKDDSWIRFDAAIQPNQSFSKQSGANEWHDLYDSKECARIKGFANPAISNTTRIDNATIENIQNKEYSGEYISQDFTVTLDGKTLQENIDYEVSYTDNKDVGTASIVITGIGEYRGAIIESFTILPVDIASDTITVESIGDYNFASVEDEPEIKPSVVVKDGTIILVRNRDYKLEYKNNQCIGQASVIIKGIGNYTKEREEKFNIVTNNGKNDGASFDRAIGLTLNNKTFFDVENLETKLFFSFIIAEEGDYYFSSSEGVYGCLYIINEDGEKEEYDDDFDVYSKKSTHLQSGTYYIRLLSYNDKALNSIRIGKNTLTVEENYYYKEIFSGEQAELTVIAESTLESANLSYKWFDIYNDETISDNSPSIIVTPENYGYYSCVVSDGEEEETVEFEVLVCNESFIIENDEVDVPLFQGRSVDLIPIVRCKEDTELTYSWYRYEHDDEEDEGYWNPIDGACSSTLSVEKTGDYRCVISDGLFNKSVYFWVYETDPFYVYGSVEDIELKDGQAELIVDVELYDKDAILSYKWQRYDDAEGSYITLDTTDENTYIIQSPGDYKCIVTDNNGFSDYCYFSVIEKLVKSIAYTPVKEKVLTEGVDGYWTSEYSEEDDKLIDFFHYRFSYNEGDILSVEWLDNSKGVVDYVYSLVKDGNTYVPMFVSKEGEVLPNGNDLRFSDNQYEEHWVAPGQYYFDLYYNSVSTRVKVSIIGNPIESIEYSTLEDHTLLEGKDGFFTTDYQGNEYFHYFVDFKPGDILTVYWSDESKAPTVYVCTRYKENDYYINRFVSEEDEVLDDVYLYDNQWEKPWVEPGEYQVVINYSGKECYTTYVLVENQLSSISFTPAGGGRKLKECTGGYYAIDNSGEFYYHYNFNYQVGDIITIMTSDNDSAIEYTYDGNSFVSKSGATIETRLLRYYDNQYTKHWIPGENTIRLEYEGRFCDVPIIVEAGCVKNVEYIPYTSEPLELLQYSNGYWRSFNDKEFFYYWYYYEEGDKFKITFSDDTVRTYEYKNVSEDYRYEFVNIEDDKDIIPIDSYDIDNDQLFNPWIKCNTEYVFKPIVFGVTASTGRKCYIKERGKEICYKNKSNEIWCSYNTLSDYFYFDKNEEYSLCLSNDGGHSGIGRSEDLQVVKWEVSNSNVIDLQTETISKDIVIDGKTGNADTVIATIRVKKTGTAVVTATLSDGQTISKEINLINSKPDEVTEDPFEDIGDLEYTGEYIEPTLLLKNGYNFNTEDYSVFYENNRYPGQATVTITFVGDFRGTIKKHFNIIKCKNSYLENNTPTAIEGLIYTGEYQDLVSKGYSKYGDVLYSLEEDGEYLSSVPEAKDADCYTVWYKVDEGEYYEGIDKASVSVSIAKATNAYQTELIDQTRLFNGEEQKLIPEIIASFGTVVYSLSEDGNYTEVIPTAKEPGIYTVWYKVEETNNYSGLTVQSVKTTITEFNIVNGVLIKYLGNSKNVVIPEGVTKIGQDAFKDNKTIETIQVDKDVIVQNAFSGCTNLQLVSISARTLAEYKAFMSKYGQYCSPARISMDTLSLDIEGLKVVSKYASCLKLAWEEYPNKTVSKYVIERDGEKVGETTDLCYIDYYLTENNEYIYKIYGLTDDNKATESTVISVKPEGIKFKGISTNHNNTITVNDKEIVITAENTGILKDFNDNNLVGTLYYYHESNGKERVKIGDAVTTVDEAEVTYKVTWETSEEYNGDYKVVFSVPDPGNVGMEIEGNITVDMSIPKTIVNVNAVGSDKSIELSWKKSAEVTSNKYIIYRKAQNEKDFSVLKTINNRDTCSYSDSNVTKDIEYTYYIITENSLDVCSEPSSEVVAKLKKDIEEPVIKKVTPESSSVVNGVVTIKVIADDNVGVKSILAEYYTNNEDQRTTIGTAENGESVIAFDTSKIVDGDYCILISVIDEAGNVATRTVQYKVDNTGPDAVNGIAVHAKQATVITLKWNDVEASDRAGFILQQKNADSYETIAENITTLGYNITGLKPGTEYTFRVAAIDNVGNIGIYSEDYVASTEADTQVPVIIDQSPDPSYFRDVIKFYAKAEDNFGIKSISVEVSIDGNTWTQLTKKTYAESKKIQTINYDILLNSYEDGPLYVRAIAEDLYGNLSDSDTYSQYTVDKTPPQKPVGLSGSGEEGKITLSWTQGEIGGSYTVYRSTNENGEFTLLKSGISANEYSDTTVESKKFYYYRITQDDLAGNTSEFSDVFGIRASSDNTNPAINEISPENNAIIGPSYRTVSVSVSDNVMLGGTTIEYSVNDDEDFTEVLNKLNLNTKATIIDAEIPFANMDDGDVVNVRIKVYDADGNTSIENIKYTVDKNAPGIRDLNCVKITHGIKITWQDNDESDLSGFKLYRIGSKGTSLLKTFDKIATVNEYSYEDADLENGDYSYRVDAFDIYGNKNSASTETITYRENHKPNAVVNGRLTMEVGVEELFDGYESSDDSGIIEYRWNFGDGNTATGETAVHSYSSIGEYTVTLTVVDEEGLTDETQMTVSVKDSSNVGTLNVTVVDGDGHAISAAPVYLNLGSPNQQKVYTDSQGKGTYKLEKGDYVIGSYKNGYLPSTKNISIIPNAVRDITLTMIKQDIVTGEFDVHRMTLDEIKAAGIDVNDPANQNVCRVKVTVIYGVEKYELTYLRNVREILQSKWNRISGGGGIGGGGSGGGGIGGGSSGGPVGVVYIPNDEGEELIAILSIDMKASVLKEFFNARLSIINNADSNFVLKNNSVDLSIPEGLTLMSDGIVGDYNTSSHVEFAELKGKETKTMSWILRGDEIGDYNLTAKYNGLLDVFNEPVSATFATDEPIEVYGLSNLTFEVEISDKIHHDFIFNAGIKNNGTIDYYCPSLDVNEKVWNITASTLNLKDHKDFWKTAQLLDVRHILADGDVEHPEWLEQDGKIFVDCDTLAPGETLFYDYIVYDIVSNDDISTLKRATYEILEGICGGVNIRSLSDLSLLYDVATTSPTNFSPNLAKRLMTLANAAYGGKSAIKDELELQGVDANNIESYNYYSESDNPNYGEDTVAYSIGINENSYGRKVITIPIRGSYGDIFSLTSDWRSNLHLIDANGHLNPNLHAGFDIAATKIYDMLDERQLLNADYKYVITGHSRGAAVGNLLAVKLSKYGVGQDNLYAYNFACPDTARGSVIGWNLDGKYDNIFNISQFGDIVSVIPGAAGNVIANPNPADTWGKYGRSVWFSNDWANPSSVLWKFDRHRPEEYVEFMNKKLNFDEYMTWEQMVSLAGLNIVVNMFACPVDVTAYDADGNVIAAIKDNEITSIKEGVSRVIPLVIGEEKYFISLDGSKTRFEIIGNDNGEMDYASYQVNCATNTITELIKCNDVAVEDGKLFVTTIDRNDLNSRRLYTINDTDIKLVEEDGEESVSHTHNWDSGTLIPATLTKDGKITYKCDVCEYEKTLKIRQIDNNSINLNKSEYVYDGEEKTPEVTVKDKAGVSLLKDTDYTVQYSNNVEIGTAKVTITFIGKYSGTTIKNFSIKKTGGSDSGGGGSGGGGGGIAGSECDHVWNTEYTIDKKATCKSVGIKSLHCSICDAIKEGSEIEIPNAHNLKHERIDAGYMKDGLEFDICIVCGEELNKKVIPGYSKSYINSFKLKSGRKTISISWNKQSKSIQNKFNGYQIQYSNNKNFSSAKSIKVKKTSSLKKITKLEAKKKYYVRMRTYKTVKSKKYYSVWTKTKTVTVK